ASVPEFIAWARWFHLPLFFAITALLLFVRYYLGAGRAWLLWTIIGMRAAVLLVNFLVQPNFNWSQIDTLAHVEFLGESVALAGQANLRRWQWLSVATFLLMIVYVLDAAWQCRQRGPVSRRGRALVVGAGIAIPLATGALLAQAAMFGFNRLPVLG